MKLITLNEPWLAALALLSIKDGLQAIKTSQRGGRKAREENVEMQ